jgi:hypothetical protein
MPSAMNLNPGKTPLNLKPELRELETLLRAREELRNSKRA